MRGLVRIKFVGLPEHVEYPDHFATFNGSWLVLQGKQRDGGKLFQIGLPVTDIEKVEVIEE